MKRICFVCMVPILAAFLVSPVLAEEQEKDMVKDKVTIEEITVKGTLEEAKVGKAEEGYRVDSVSVGPLGDKDIMDTPYSITVLSNDLIETQRASHLRDIYKLLPSVDLKQQTGTDTPRPQTRGFKGGNVENSRIDGMSMSITTTYPLEIFERIEVTNGLTGSLYGPSYPSGTFNFVLKRPTDEPYQALTMDYSTNEKTNYHLDLGGPIGDKFGYRINMLYGDGEWFVENSNVRRKGVAVGFDWKVTDKTVAEFNYFYHDHNVVGYPSGFIYSSGIKLPDAPDPTRVGYGQEWTSVRLITRTASTRIKHDFNTDWHLIAGFLTQISNRNEYNIENTLTDNNGNYKTTFKPKYSDRYLESGLFYVNGSFDTGSLTHDLSVGGNGYRYHQFNPVTAVAKMTVGTANIDDPLSFNEPEWSLDGNRYKGNDNSCYIANLGDTITFNKSWSTLLSASYSWITAKKYNTKGVETYSMSDSGFSSAVSLMYKPRENMTAYITYADSLQKGDTAPDTAANAGETMSPYRSEQWETGLKVALSKMNLTGALFRIERPFAYLDTDNVFGVQGQQVNYGLELMAIGEVIDRVTVYAGATFLDPKLTQTSNPATEDQQVIGVPKVNANLLVEYRAPFLTGLTPFVNLHYKSKLPANETNTSWAREVVTIDLGTRYTTKIMGVETTWRLAATNLTDEQYWANIAPSGTDGTDTGATAYHGLPREIIASVQLKF